MPSRTAFAAVVALLLALAACKTSRAREPGEPIDLPLDDIDTVVAADGGAEDVTQVDEVDGGQQVEGAGAGEPSDGLGMDLRDM